MVPIYPDFGENFPRREILVEKNQDDQLWDHFSTDAYQPATRGTSYDINQLLVPLLVPLGAFWYDPSVFIPCPCHPLEGQYMYCRWDLSRMSSTPSRNQYVATKSPVVAETPHNFRSMRFLILPLGNGDKLLRQSYTNVPLLSPNRPKFTSRAMKLRKNPAH